MRAIFPSDMAKVYLICLLLGCSAFAQVVVTRDCGALGYPADDTATLQACQDANPSKHLVFPKVNAAGEFDYKILSPLHVKGREPWLEGEVGNGLGYGGVNIYAPNGGLILEQPDTFVPKIESLCFFGYSPEGSNFNGIEVRAAGTQLINICAISFSGHGVLLNGDVNAGNNSSLTKMLGTNRLNWNKGDGLHIEGHDTQVGIFEGIDAENNSGYGINELSAYGNVFIAPHSSSNTLGCYNTKDGSVQSGTWEFPYCEGDQPAPHFGSGNIVLGGIFTPETNGRYSQTYSAGGWKGWTWELKNPYSPGNIALRMKASGYKLHVYSDPAGNEQFRVTVNSGYSIGGPGGVPNYIQFYAGNTYLYTKFRFGPTLFFNFGTAITGSACSNVYPEIRWNDTLNVNVGDPIGWRCVAGQWHGFGVIQ